MQLLHALLSGQSCKSSMVMNGTLAPERSSLFGYSTGPQRWAFFLCILPVLCLSGNWLAKGQQSSHPTTFSGAFVVLEPALFDLFLAMLRSHLAVMDTTALALPCVDLLSTFNMALFSPLFWRPVYLSAVITKLNLSDMFRLSQAFVSLGLKAANYHLYW